MDLAAPRLVWLPASEFQVEDPTDLREATTPAQQTNILDELSFLYNDVRDLTLGRSPYILAW